VVNKKRDKFFEEAEMACRAMPLKHVELIHGGILGPMVRWIDNSGVHMMALTDD